MEGKEEREWKEGEDRRAEEEMGKKRRKDTQNGKETLKEQRKTIGRENGKRE